MDLPTTCPQLAKADVHEIMLVNVDSRLKVRLDMHFREHYARYVRSGDILRRIHIQPVDDPTANRATGYALKSLEWRIPDTDRIFIRPRTVSELPVKGQGEVQGENAYQ
jgi:hypothetical protein